jgi:hypothetical protein
VGIGVEGCYRNFADHTYLVPILHLNSDPSQILETLQVNRTKVPSLLACSSRIRVASPEQSSRYRLVCEITKFLSTMMRTAHGKVRSWPN